MLCDDIERVGSYETGAHIHDENHDVPLFRSSLTTTGKDIPLHAQWTRIDRDLVNPQALKEAKERFEERVDCVIVLRVLMKEDIQKLADRTYEIRMRRGTSSNSVDCLPNLNRRAGDAYEKPMSNTVTKTEPAEVDVYESLLDRAEHSTGVVTQLHHFEDSDDTVSVCSSLATSVASVFSVESLASSASDLSRASG